MKTIFVRQTPVKSFTLLGKQDSFAKDVLRENEIVVDMHFISKTMISLSVQSGENRYKINYKSEYSEKNNLTLVEKIENNYFTGTRNINYYFKYTKKQNLEVLKNHIESLIEWLLSFLHIRNSVDYDNFLIKIEVPNNIWEKELTSTTEVM